MDCQIVVRKKKNDKLLKESVVQGFKASLQVYLTFPGPTIVVWMFSKQVQAPLTKPGFWIHSVFLYLYLALSYEVSTEYITVGWEWKNIQKVRLSEKPSFSTSLHVVSSSETSKVWIHLKKYNFVQFEVQYFP